MSIAQSASKTQPKFVDRSNNFGGKHVKSIYVGRDPLTGHAYFDAVDITAITETEKRHDRRVARNPSGHWMEINVHADILKVNAIHSTQVLSPTNGGGGTRGTVRGFSRASRKRMIEFMAKARLVGQLLFATFTYPDAFPSNDLEAWHAHFEALRRRIERRYPNWRILWRKEMKERKSGQYVGFDAPHWHMIIDTCNEAAPNINVEHYVSYGRSHPKTTSTLSRMFEKWSLRAWFEIVGSGDEKHSEHGSFVVACRNRRHAYKYISKYVAKEENDDHEVGRRWGRIGNWDISPSTSVILTKIEVIELKRLLRGWMKSKSIDYRKFIASMPLKNGFSIFGLGDTARTGDLFEQIINHAACLAGELPPFG